MRERMEKKSVRITDRRSASVIYKPSSPPIRAHLNPLPGTGPMPRFVCMILLLAATALSQDDSTGAIRGSVFDSTGGRIHGASVALVNTATGLRYGITTGSEGRFAFDLLPPGEYSARAEAVGMSPQIAPNLRVEVGGVSDLEFKLAIAGTKEIVTVSGEQPLVETQPSAVSSLIDERAINELPLNGRRYTDLALLTPGVTQDPRGLTSGSNGDGVWRHSRLPIELSCRWRR